MGSGGVAAADKGCVWLFSQPRVCLAVTTPAWVFVCWITLAGVFGLLDNTQGMCLGEQEVHKGMDKSKITRKQSKASKHGHENQKSSKRSQRSKALANFHLQGPFLHFSKVIYNLRERKERQGPNVQSFQTSTVLTVKEEAGNPFTIHPSSPISLLW
ncbi:hypothetical protein Tco_0409741 [Tanacetum coccineum]